jgi:glycosyltransferase involved in cell wall biosynthesis
MRWRCPSAVSGQAPPASSQGKSLVGREVSIDLHGPSPTRGTVLTQRRVHVLHVAAGNLFGGVETFLRTLARYRQRVPELDSEFALCFEGRLAAELRAESAVLHLLGNVRLRDPASILRANAVFMRILRKNPFDAVVTHGEWPHTLFGMTTKLCRTKLVAWAHGAPQTPHLLDSLAKQVRPNLLIANSRHTAAALGPSLAKVPTRVIACPVEPNSAPLRSRAELRRELNVPESTVVIVFAARFERWKGHELLLRAARALLDRDAGDWRIWMCGGVQRSSDELFAEQLRGYVRDVGLTSRVQFLGARSDIPDVFGAADVFCQPNTGPEPFGIVFVEALYAGLPVVATRMGGAAEIVDESCGLLVEPSAELVASALHSMVVDSNLRRRLSRGGPKRARELCDPEARIREIAEAIRS